jgi:stalled ribosome rescue protein Dom34
MHKYYDEVKQKLQGLDAVLLFGHGLAQEEFRNYLHEDKHFSAKEIIVKSATNLTENETIAFVRKYFSSES